MSASTADVLKKMIDKHIGEDKGIQKKYESIQRELNNILHVLKSDTGGLDNLEHLILVIMKMEEFFNSVVKFIFDIKTKYKDQDKNKAISVGANDYSDFYHILKEQSQFKFHDSDVRSAWLNFEKRLSNILNDHEGPVENYNREFYESLLKSMTYIVSLSLNPDREKIDDLMAIIGNLVDKIQDKKTTRPLDEQKAMNEDLSQFKKDKQELEEPSLPKQYRGISQQLFERMNQMVQLQAELLNYIESEMKILSVDTLSDNHLEKLRKTRAEIYSEKTQKSLMVAPQKTFSDLYSRITNEAKATAVDAFLKQVEIASSSYLDANQPGTLSTSDWGIFSSVIDMKTIIDLVRLSREAQRESDFSSKFGECENIISIIDRISKEDPRFFGDVNISEIRDRLPKMSDNQFRLER